MNRISSILLAALPLGASAAVVDLSGLVVDKGVHPLPGISVSLALAGDRTTTDSLGFWNFKTQTTGIQAAQRNRRTVSRHIQVMNGRIQLDLNGFDISGRPLRTASATTAAGRFSARSQILGMDTLVYARNGIVLARSPLDTLVRSGILQIIDTSSTISAPPGLQGIRTEVRTGAKGDTLLLGSIPTATGWNLTLRVHSKSAGWETRSADRILFGPGIDSLGGAWTRTGSLAPDTLVATSVPIDHRYRVGIINRDRTKDSVWVTRIGGFEWFAQNLNYDITGDTMDVCYGNNPANCASYGRYYTAAQALNLVDDKGALKHDCDTLPNVGENGAACPTIDLQGVCPTGWRLPTAADWDSLTTITDGVTGSGKAATGRLYAGAWESFTGEDWFGFGIKPTYAMGLEKNKNWNVTGGLRSVFWASTPYQDQAMTGTAFVPADSYYGTHTMWYYNPLVTPKERAAYSVRCLRLPPPVHVPHDSASLDTLTWTIAAGPSNDTVVLGRIPTVKGWKTFLELHSKSSGWSTFAPASRIAARGVDSARAVLSDSGSPETMVLAPRALDRRFPVKVTYRDGSAGSVNAVRIGGMTWMAENLNYDISGDTMDVCLENNPSKCAAFGRYYTAAQALNLVDGKGKLKHDCDTLPNVGKIGSSCPSIDPQGACPTGWHIPSASEWDSLTMTTDGVKGSGVASGGRLYAGDWESFTGSDWFGMGIKPSFAMGLEVNKDWNVTGGLRSVFWTSTPYQDQAVNGTAFVPTNSYYGTHTMWYYNPLVTPKERAAYPIRCVKN